MAAAAAALLLLTLAVGYVNGANDVSKGIATLVGSGVSDLRAALSWGAAWTVAGALLAAFASQGLVATFSGKGFLASPIGGEAFLGAVASGAAAWVALASWTGLPVSTTHAIAGALAGAGLVAQGAGALHWGFLARKVVLPLALSPILAAALLYAASPLLRAAAARMERYCVCVERRVLIAPGEAAMADARAAAVLAATDSPRLATREECSASGAIARRLELLDAFHWISAALTSLARGLNDAPKILALGVAASAAFGMAGSPLYALVAAAVGAGSVISGMRVTETLARRVTRMAPAEGFSANLATAALVGIASWNGLPVSTTHVSSGAIIGIGLRAGHPGGVRWRTVRDMALAWFVTLPAAAAIGGAAYALLR